MTKNKKIIFLIILLETLSFNVNSIGQNLVHNGSMTSVAGIGITAPQWTVLAGSPDINEVAPLSIPTYSWFMGFPVASSDGGTWQNLISFESIQQTISGLSIGQTYYFSFEYCLQAIANTVGTEYAAVVTPNVSITGASGYVNPAVAGNFYTWMRHSIPLVATATSITIRATGNGDSYLAYDGFYLSTQPLLPVKLIEFNATPGNSIVQLTWNTAFEINSSRFIIQKSINGRNWKDIGMVNANHHANQLTNYKYNDASSMQSLNYYRLKMVDNDGSFELSKVCAIKMPASEPGIFSIYPNPIHSTARLLLNDPVTKAEQFELYDISGRKLKLIPIPPGADFIDVDFSCLKKGNYLLKLVGSKTSKYVIIN